jgi:hypothetical protein
LDRGRSTLDAATFKGPVKIGLDGSDIKQLKRYTPTLSPAAVAANTTAEQTFTVTGLAVGDVVIAVNKPTAQAGLSIAGYRVSAVNTLAITFGNHTGASITPTAGQTYELLVWRP